MPVLSLFNICGGASDERFKREVGLILENIQDPNVPVEQKRSITLTYSFTAMKDRSGAAVSLDIKTKLGAAEGVDSTVFFTRRGDEMVAIPYDPNQESFRFVEEELKRTGKK